MSAARGSRGRNRLASVAAVVRRLPGGTRVAGSAARRIRSSPALREGLSRLLDLDSGIGTPSFLAGGNLLSGLGMENLPVVVVDMVGLPTTDAGTAITAIAREQVLTGAFRPVVLTDDGAGLGAARKYGYPAELVVREADWTGAQLWSEYVAGRVGAIMRFYPAAWTVRVASLGELAGALVLLRALTAPHDR